MKSTFVDVNDAQQEVRIKDEPGHYLGKVVNGIFYAYCKRCKKHHKVSPEENKKQ
jgi:hypothetical protein